MALFSDLFNESATENNTYSLSGLPLATFAEGTSFLDMGSKGMILAETGWMDICESVRNAVLLEGIGTVAKVAGAHIKAGFERVVDFLKKVPENLKKIASIIFGTINKFLVTIGSLIKQDNNLLDAEKAKKGLAKYNELHKEPLYITGFMFADGTGAAAAVKFADGVKAAKDIVEEFYKDSKKYLQAGQDKGYEVGKEPDKDELDKNIRIAMVGETPKTGEVTSRSFLVDLKDSFGANKGKDDKVDAKKYIDVAVAQVKAGYKDSQNDARKLYKETKAAIEEWIKDCNELAKAFASKIKDAASEKAETDEEKESKKTDIEANKLAVDYAEKTGRAMQKATGIFSSYTGAYCSLLRDQYMTYKKILTTCMGYAKVPEKKAKNEAVTTESSDSLFGLDLI